MARKKQSSMTRRRATRPRPEQLAALMRFLAPVRLTLTARIGHAAGRQQQGAR